MTEVFGPNEIEKVRARWIALIVWYTIAAAVVVAADVLLIVYLKPISYAGGLAADIVLTAVFGCATLFYFELPFRMTDKYRKFLLSLDSGLESRGQGVFLYFDEETTEENGVTFVGVVLEERLFSREGVRRMFLEHSHARPDFHTGDTVAYVCKSNVLTAYEVTERIPDELLSDQERGLPEDRQDPDTAENAVRDTRMSVSVETSAAVTEATAPGADADGVKQSTDAEIVAPGARAAYAPVAKRKKRKPADLKPPQDIADEQVGSDAAEEVK